MSYQKQIEIGRRRIMEPETLRALVKGIREHGTGMEVLSPSSYCHRVKKVTLREIDDYVSKGIPIGGFLEAVLSNNFIDSLANADEDNKRTLWELHIYIINYTPSACWGSVGKVEAWLAAHTFCAKEEKESYVGK